jgi:hypothetical protein
MSSERTSIVIRNSEEKRTGGLLTLERDDYGPRGSRSLVQEEADLQARVRNFNCWHETCFPFEDDLIGSRA